MLQDIIHSERICGYDISILLYSIEREDRNLFDNRNHYYDIRISWNDKYDSFDDVFEFIYTKKEAFKLFKKAKEYAKDDSNKMNRDKPVKEIEKEYNIVINATTKMLKSLDEFIDFDTLAIVNGILWSVFTMIYKLAPDCDTAKITIFAALDHFEQEIGIQKNE